MFLHEHRGAGYRHYIKELVERRSARTYLEVGVRDGETLAMIGVPSIGVDPNFQLNFPVASGKKRLFLFQMTSDEFFRDHDPRDVLRSPIDVVFLDGLHQFEYLLRDFINSEKICHRSSVILLDDCLPVNVEMTERTFEPEQREDRERARMWTGDVWKILPILQKYRPELRIVAADTFPTGNVAVTNLDPDNTVLRDHYFRIVDDFLALPSNAETIEALYQSLHVHPTATIMSGFDTSLYLGT